MVQLGSTEDGGGGGNGGPLPGPWNVLGIGERSGRPSRRDIVRKRPAEEQLAFLRAKLTTRTPGTTAYERTAGRLSGIEDVVSAAITLGIDPARATRRVIQEIAARLGLDLSLKKIERGRAPDLSVLAAAARAATAGPDPNLPTTPGLPQPSPVPQPTTAPAPPGLPPNWWDWQLWQRALYGGLSLAGLFRQQPTTTRAPTTVRFPRPSAPIPGPVGPAGAPGLPAPVGGGSVPIHETIFPSVFGDAGSFDFGGLVQSGIDIYQQLWGSNQPPIIMNGGFPGTPGPPTPFPGPPISVGQSGIPQVTQAGLPALIPGALGLAGGVLAETIQNWLTSSPDVGMFKPSGGERIIPRSRIDAVGPDGRCYTWLRAIPYGLKVRGVRVDGRRRHHHHYRKR